MRIIKEILRKTDKDKQEKVAAETKRRARDRRTARKLEAQRARRQGATRTEASLRAGND